MMRVFDPGQFTQELHETNRRLKFWLDSLPASSAFTDAVLPVPTPQQMSGLLSELLRAGEWLRARPEHPDAELEHELSEYRAQVERLRSLLPFIHRALLSERARLEQERERVSAAAEWAYGSRQTL
jgi:hypothetical protein